MKIFLLFLISLPTSTAFAASIGTDRDFCRLGAAQGIDSRPGEDYYTEGDWLSAQRFNARVRWDCAARDAIELKSELIFDHLSSSTKTWDFSWFDGGVLSFSETTAYEYEGYSGHSGFQVNDFERLDSMQWGETGLKVVYESPTLYVGWSGKSVRGHILCKVPGKVSVRLEPVGSIDLRDSRDRVVEYALYADAERADAWASPDCSRIYGVVGSERALFDRLRTRLLQRGAKAVGAGS